MTTNWMIRTTSTGINCMMSCVVLAMSVVVLATSFISV